MILNLRESVSDEMFNKIISAYNSLKDEEKLEIYLNTEGGDMEAAEVIIDFVNQHRDRTILIANGTIFSAGFYIFFRSNCERRIVTGTTGMCHLIRVSIEYGEHDKPYYKIDKVNKDWLLAQRQWTDRLCKKLGVTKEEIKKIDKGKEVYFNYKRLNELLENARDI